MKKVVIIMLLLFAFSLQANAINNIEKQEITKQELELDGPGTRWGCTTTSSTSVHMDGGVMYIVTVSVTECKVVAQ